MHTKTVFELLNEAGRAITSEIELEKVVQRVTDIGTKLIGAQFGAFFYNVTNQSGGSLMLYSISGVSKEAFSKFPMPRNTQIFDHTFSAKCTVRYEDVTSQPHYGQNPPYLGMPNGHLPDQNILAICQLRLVFGNSCHDRYKKFLRWSKGYMVNRQSFIRIKTYRAAL